MSTDNNQIKITNNTQEERYEVWVDGHVAELVYEREGDQITYLHTGVPRELEGRGIGSQLAHAALEDARNQHLTVVPLCPFVKIYIQRHPEYLSLLSEEQRTRLRKG